ncbi:MAG TPA: hypothetical protein VF495_02860, partial [Phenylobacterium sp.]
CPPPGAINPDTGRPYRPTSDCPRSAPPSEPPPRPRRDDDGGGSVVPLIVGAGLLAALVAASNDPPKPPPAPRKPTPDELLANGPLVFAANALGTFSAYGFVQDGAPIVVDVQADPSARTQLNITVGDRVSSLPIDPGGEPLVIRYQGGGAAEPQVALLKLTSTVRNSRGKDMPSPIQVTGLGAGERAMGSVAINQLSFGPPLLQAAAGGQATLGYVTESPFDLLATDILRYWRGGGNTIVVERVWRRTYRQLNPRAYSGGPWNGRDAANKASKGSHLLQVTGWELTGDRAWVAAFSPTNVEVK